MTDRPPGGRLLTPGDTPMTPPTMAPFVSFSARRKRSARLLWACAGVTWVHGRAVPSRGTDHPAHEFAELWGYCPYVWSTPSPFTSSPQSIALLGVPAGDAGLMVSSQPYSPVSSPPPAWSVSLFRRSEKYTEYPAPPLLCATVPVVPIVPANHFARFFASIDT